MKYHVQGNSVFVEAPEGMKLIRSFPNEIYRYALLPGEEIAVCLYWHPEPLDDRGIYCLRSDGSIKWQIQQSIRFNDVSWGIRPNPYIYVGLKDGKLSAADQIGHDYEVDMNNGDIRKVGYTK